ncbi:response regulator [Sulfitobacter sp. S0837]|uniref:hybrid sensor histidine kinase/response regulator n=1 Tax=Sulfitobacter maritimus TaxID=2741719 RepID=UPI0015823D47|nr:response regulator [Sulfitobacter maritimus]NUH64760.1 response regulator [Sulfitobacter maritimus]
MIQNFQKILEAAPSPFMLLDHELRVVWANAAYLDVTEREADKLFGRKVLEEFPADPDSESEQMLIGSFERVLRSGVADHLPVIPYPITDAQGRIRERFWSATHTPILDSEGKVEFILQHTQDITEVYDSKTKDAGAVGMQADMVRRAREVSQQNLEQETAIRFFKLIFEQAPNFMATLIGPDHVYRTVNDAYYQVVGHRELIGKTLREAIPEIEGQGFITMLDDVYRTGTAVRQSGAEAILQRTPEGPHERVYVDFVFQPLTTDAGDVIGIVVQGHDVTAQKVAEANLREAEERFRSMAHVMPVHVWTASPDGRLDWLSDQIYSYAGAEPGSLEGDVWPSIIHPDDRDAAIEVWTSTLRNQTKYETEFRIRRADGVYRWHIVRATPIRDAEGNLSRWVGTNSDIHDQKAMSQQLVDLNTTLEERVTKRNRELEELHTRLAQSQRVEAIGNLAGGIAHDFNNLLQVMTGSLTMAAREMPAESPARVRIDAAMRAVERGASLSSQLLAFSRRQPLQPRPLDLRELLEDIDDMLRSALGEGVSFDIKAPDTLWPAFVDAASTQNAVLNLALNARDALEDRGALRIAIANKEFTAKDLENEPEMSPGKYVEIKVMDNGPGIPPETLEKVFDPFFTTKPVGKGTGLGLSTVYGFARQSGGRVTIESVVGAGTTVSLLLPRAQDAAEPLRWHDTDDIKGGTETVLLVEDDAEVRDATSAMLSDLGYRVRSAQDPAAALSLAQVEPDFDLVISDVVMPGKMTSRELANILQAEHPGLPFLFISGYSQDAIVRDGRVDAGVNLLSKPFTHDALALRVREALDESGRSTADQTPDRPRRILLCEDDALIRLDIADILESLGTNVTETGTGQEALQMLKTGAFDALLIDVGLPDISGEEVAIKVRDSLPDIPIIFATGQSDVPAARKLGNCAVVNKPFGDRDLARALEQVGVLPKTKTLASA